MAECDCYFVDSALTKTATSTVASPTDPAAANTGTQSLEHAPLRVKVTLLVVVAVSGGAAIGAGVSQSQSGQFLLPLSLTTLILILLAIAARWIWRPLERLVKIVGQITLENRGAALERLPMHRRDEIGDISRSLHELTRSGIRRHREAHLIRKTIDTRVADATRKATTELRRIAMRDALTDLGNRHFLDDHLDSLVDSIRAGVEDLTCLAFDVDNFKQINDTLGHACGDDVLVLIGSLIRGSVRQTDYAVRLGGDEFVILLPGADIDRVHQLAARIRSLFRQHADTTLGAHMAVDLSMGLATLKGDRIQNGRDLLDIADRRLYENKRAKKAKLAAAAV